MWRLEQDTKALEPVLTPAQFESYRQQQAIRPQLIKDLARKRRTVPLRNRPGFRMRTSPACAGLSACACQRVARAWQRRMNRRQFLEAVAVGLVAVPALGSLPPTNCPSGRSAALASRCRSSVLAPAAGS